MLFCSKILFLFIYLVVLLFLNCDINFFSLSLFEINSSIFKFAYSIKISRNLTNGNLLGSRKGSLFNTLDSINKYQSNTFHSNESFNVKSLNNFKNRYSFVHYNIFPFKNENKFSNYRKIKITPCNNIKHNIGFYSNSKSQTPLYLFDSLRNWIEYKFSAWYVPPMPIGEKVSVKLRALGPVQSDEDSNAFLLRVGAEETDTIFDVVDKYRDKMKNGDDDTKYFLRKYFKEFIRKFYIVQFERIEDVASKGYKAWRDHWKPTIEELEEDPNTLSKQDEQFLSWWKEPEKIEEYLRDIKKQRKKLNLIETSRFQGLIRLSKDFKGRLYKCSKTMFPLMALGLIPELGPLSIGISTILASKIIYQGDPKQTDTNRDYTMYISSRGYDKSEAIKSIATMFIVTVHSMLGYFMSCMTIAYTKLGSFIPSEIINSFFINLQLTLTALIYDTSELTYEEKVEMAKSRSIDIPIDIKPTPNYDII